MRLDWLAQEERRMVGAQIRKITNTADDGRGLTTVDNGATNIDERATVIRVVKAVDEKVAAVVDGGAQYVVHQSSKRLTGDVARWKMSTCGHSPRTRILMDKPHYIRHQKAVVSKITWSFDSVATGECEAV